MSRIKEELDGHDEQDSGGKRSPPISRNLPNNKIDQQDRHPPREREWKPRSKCILPESEERCGSNVVLDPRRTHHHELIVLPRAEIRIYESHAIPGFRNAEFQNIRAEYGSVAFVRPQIASTEICKYEGGADYGDDREGPVRSYLSGHV